MNIFLKEPNSQENSWVPAGMKDLGDITASSSNIFEQIEKDREAEKIATEIVENFHYKKFPHSPKKLESILGEIDKIELYDEVKKVLSNEHHVQFKNLDRERFRRGRK